MPTSVVERENCDERRRRGAVPKVGCVDLGDPTLGLAHAAVDEASARSAVRGARAGSRRRRPSSCCSHWSAPLASERRRRARRRAPRRAVTRGLVGEAGVVGEIDVRDAQRGGERVPLGRRRRGEEHPVRRRSRRGGSARRARTARGRRSGASAVPSYSTMSSESACAIVRSIVVSIDCPGAPRSRATSPSSERGRRRRAPRTRRRAPTPSPPRRRAASTCLISLDRRGRARAGTDGADVAHREPGPGADRRRERRAVAARAVDAVAGRVEVDEVGVDASSVAASSRSRSTTPARNALQDDVGAPHELVDDGRGPRRSRCRRRRSPCPAAP